ncbi:MAG: peptide chain release factor-like protein [Acidimicrobiales bacterium]|jgi:ribosome-associated protein
MSDPAPGELVTKSGIRIPQRALSWRFSRSSGPGGQHVNKTDTRVELTCSLAEVEGPAGTVERVRERLGAEVRVVAASERSQLANRAEAARRLMARVDSAARTKRPRRSTRPSKGAVEARLEEKRHQSQRKAARRPALDD